MNNQEDASTDIMQWNTDISLRLSSSSRTLPPSPPPPLPSSTGRCPRHRHPPRPCPHGRPLPRRGRVSANPSVPTAAFFPFPFLGRRPPRPWRPCPFLERPPPLPSGPLSRPASFPTAWPACLPLDGPFCARRSWEGEGEELTGAAGGAGAGRSSPGEEELNGTRPPPTTSSSSRARARGRGRSIGGRGRGDAREGGHAVARRRDGRGITFPYAMNAKWLKLNSYTYNSSK